MHTVKLGNGHPGKVEVPNKVPNLLGNVLCIPHLVAHNALIVYHNFFGTTCFIVMYEISTISGKK
jgi:hypothetical protein